MPDDSYDLLLDRAVSRLHQRLAEHGELGRQTSRDVGIAEGAGEARHARQEQDDPRPLRHDGVVGDGAGVVGGLGEAGEEQAEPDASADRQGERSAGACCLPAGTCVQTTVELCEVQGGRFEGVNSVIRLPPREMLMSPTTSR